MRVTKTASERLDPAIQRVLQPASQRMLIPALATASADVPASWVERLFTRVRGMRRKAATVVLIVLSTSLFAYVVLGHDGVAAYRLKQHQAAELHQQILAVQKENQRLALHDQRLQGDPDTIEDEAREQMHYTRPGEVIYTLPKAPGASQHK